MQVTPLPVAVLLGAASRARSPVLLFCSCWAAEAAAMLER